MAEHTLNGKNVLIAGGAKNLGGLIARQAAEAGANVAIHYNSDSSRADAEQTLAAVEAAGGKGAMFQGDLTVPANVTRLFADAEAAVGKIDIAVNTAGKVLRKPIVETTEDEYDSMFDINAKAASSSPGRGQEPRRRRKDHHDRDGLAGSLHRWLLHLRRWQVTGGALHSGSGQGVHRSRDLRNGHRARSDGYPVLLWTGDP